MKFTWKNDNGKADANAGQPPSAAPPKLDPAAAASGLAKLDAPRPAPGLAKPAPAAQTARTAIQLPLSASLKSMIETVAEASGRSVADEIVIRLEQSLRDDRLEVLLHDILARLPAAAPTNARPAARRSRRKKSRPAAAIKTEALNSSNDK